MKTTKEKSGHAKMRPRARLISLLGDELISDESVAVVELVKNSYDADATRVSIAFPDPNSAVKDTLTIADDGCGMNLKRVLEGWFEPGTILKRRKDRSDKGRLFQGEKGVGRFAAARLAESLYMMTKTEKDEGVVVLLDWGKFDNNSYLDEIEIDYEVQSLPEIKHGTILQLINLRREWTKDDYENLHARLSRLISPILDAEDEKGAEDFEIELDIPLHPELTGKVEPHALTKKPKYKLSGLLSTEGLLTGSIFIDGKRIKQFKNHHIGSPDETVDCGSFSVEVRTWDRDRIGLSPYMLKFSESLTGIRRILNAYCGVSIYRDGFRVHPYGETGNDWLSLDTRSRQNPTLRLASNQIIAAIRIGRHSNPDIKDRSTREGLVHNNEYAALKEWFIRVLALLEEARYEVRPREDATREELTTLYEAFDLSEVSQEVEKKLGKKHPVAKLIRKKEGDIRDGVKRLQEHYSRVLLAAGLGQLVDLVIHEIGAPLGRINRELLYVKKKVKKMIDERSYDELQKSFLSIKAWLEQIANLRGRLEPRTAGRRGRATAFSVQEEIVGNFLLYENLLSKQKIKPNLRMPKEALVVHMPRSNLGQIVANFIDNSVYWLTRHHGDGRGGIIDVHLNELKHGFKIRFCDDGPGVPEEDRERIFDQNFSRKPNGMGLGLYIARQVIEPYGKLIYRDDCKLEGACFEARFEQRVGL